MNMNWDFDLIILQSVNTTEQFAEINVLNFRKINFVFINHLQNINNFTVLREMFSGKMKKILFEPHSKAKSLVNI